MRTLLIASLLLASSCLGQEQDPKYIPPPEIEASDKVIDTMGEFDEEGNFIPKDPSVKRLYEAGDFKAFFDVSLRGNGVATGFAYELKDGYTRLPFLKKRVPTTLDIAISSENVGVHWGPKVFPIIDAGFFLGFKYNFEVHEKDLTVGLQVIKLDF